MNRITVKDLRAAVTRLNLELGMPAEYSSPRVEGRFNANIGHYHIGQAYGGYSLEQVSNTSGGINSVFNCGYVPARDLYNRIQGMFAGIGAKS